MIESQGWSLDVALVGLGSVGLVLSLWWVYFLVPNAEALHHHRERAFTWTYGHFFVFGSLAALGAFLEVVADGLKEASAPHAVAPTLAIGLVAAAVGLYLLTLWWLHGRITRGRAPAASGAGCRPHRARPGATGLGMGRCGGHPARCRGGGGRRPSAGGGYSGRDTGPCLHHRRRREGQAGAP